MKPLMIVLFVLANSTGIAQTDLSTGLTPGKIETHFQPDNVPYISPESIAQVPMPNFTPSVDTKKGDWVQESLNEFSQSKKSFATQSAPVTFDANNQPAPVSNQYIEKINAQKHVVIETKNAIETGETLMYVLGIAVFILISVMVYRNFYLSETRIRETELKRKSTILSLRERDLALIQREFELAQKEKLIKG